MQNNVINFERFKEENNRPDDLMNIPEFAEKWGLKYEYLYKWAVLKKQIKVYYKAGIALSEKEVLEFERNRALKYGRNQ